MQGLDGRAFLGTALATLPLAMLAQTVETKVKPVRVPSGEDRLGEHHVIGVSSTAFKVLTDDSASALFVIEHASRKKGGPPRHLHPNENEWFYVIEGKVNTLRRSAPSASSSNPAIPSSVRVKCRTSPSENCVIVGSARE